MLRQLLIAGTSLRISEIALGVMNWGTNVSPETALRLYDAYRAAGGNVIDAAHLYACWQNTPSGENGLGASEMAVARQAEMIQASRARPVWWIIGTSLLFEAACLALAAWHFCTRDF